MFQLIDMLIHQEVTFVECSNTAPVHYESFILTVNEGLRLSCEVCAFCEFNTTVECQPPDFSLPPEEQQPKTLMEKYRRFKKMHKDRLNKTKTKMKETGKKALYNVRYKDQKGHMQLDESLDSGIIGDFMPKIFFTKSSLTGSTSIVKSDPTIFVVQDFLLFRRTLPSHSGVYDCFWRGRKRKSWAVTVWAAGREPLREIYHNGTKSNSSTNRRLRDLNLKKANIYLFSRWTNWSDCNICTIKERKKIVYGVQLRAGYCFIKKRTPIMPTRPKNAVHLNLFKSGLPCRSHLIPTEIRGLKAVAFRPSEVEIKRCFIYCKKKDYYIAKFNISGKVYYEYRYKTGLEPISVFVDYNDGSFVRTANYTDADVVDNGDDDEEVDEYNSYKLRPPRIGSTQFLVGRDDMKMRVTCPITKSIVSPFMWFQLKKKPKLSVNELMKDPFDFMNIFHKSRGRIKFDVGYNIIIASLLKEDHGSLYVCMHGSNVIGTVHLVYIDKSKTKKIIHMVSQILLILMPTILIVLTMLFIFLTLRTKIFKQKKTKEKSSK